MVDEALLFFITFLISWKECSNSGHFLKLTIFLQCECRGNCRNKINKTHIKYFENTERLLSKIEVNNNYEQNKNKNINATVLYSEIYNIRMVIKYPCKVHTLQQIIMHNYDSVTKTQH